MSKLLVDVDDEALEEAKAILGTRTKVATVNLALRQVVEEHRRRQAVAALFEDNGLARAAVEREDEVWS